MAKLGVFREGEKPHGQLREDLDLALERIRQARQQLIDATAFIGTVQQRCPHNNITQDINFGDYNCRDCQASLRVDKAGQVEWYSFGIAYKLDTFWWDRS